MLRVPQHGPEQVEGLSGFAIHLLPVVLRSATTVLPEGDETAGKRGVGGLTLPSIKLVFLGENLAPFPVSRCSSE